MPLKLSDKPNYAYSTYLLTTTIAYMLGLIPLQLNESNKFNGSNWIQWSNTIRTMAQMRGVYGYLDGMITRPSTPTTEPMEETTAAETSWNSKNPSLNEWET